MSTLLPDDALLAEHDPGDTGRVVVWENGSPVQKDWRWGFKPFEPGGRPVSLLRWEGRTIINPCLIIANDFGLKVDGRLRYRASLITSQPFFCLAGVWRLQRTAGQLPLRLSPRKHIPTSRRSRIGTSR